MSRQTPEENLNKDSCASCLEKRPGRFSLNTFCMSEKSPYYKQIINAAYKTTGRMDAGSAVYCGYWLGMQKSSPENLARKENMP